jgi:FHS family L-fucose permease-like MFS transporter
MASVAPTADIATREETNKNYLLAFSVITGLFFMWGFMTVLNDILIPYLKNLFVLNYLQATLIQFAFFGAYFIGSLIYFLASLSVGDLIGKIGYKNGIIVGLLISATGCLMFYPAAGLRVYGLFLAALFCLGLGFTLLQIAANPYVAILGSQQGASSRLNLAQGFNSIGTTIAPIIGAQLIFGGVTTGSLGAEMLQSMYVSFAIIFVVLAVIIKLTALPAFKSEEKIEKKPRALHYRQLVMGIFAIFMYGGGEVSVGSLLINFLKLPNIAGMDEQSASHYLSFYWGGLMIGRFLGAISLSGINLKNRISLMLAVFVLAFLIVASLVGWSTAIIYSILILLNLIAFFAGGSLPGRTLGIFAIVIVGLIATAIFSNGHFAMWALLGAGLFNSIMWSNIFTLSIKGLGQYTSQGSSLLIMAILGAALIPVLQGYVADRAGLQLSFVVPLCCYIYLIYYGFYGHKPRPALG